MATPPEEVVLPLRDRLSEYGAVFGVGLAAIVLIGLAVGQFTSASLIEGIAYIAMAVGAVLLLAGGATGGGYTSLGLGAAGAIAGFANRHDDDFEDEGARRGRPNRVNTSDRLRRGLRPEKNPRAFWQVIAGLIYLGAGLSILINFGT